jgi:hypothetical protein
MIGNHIFTILLGSLVCKGTNGFSSLSPPLATRISSTATTPAIGRHVHVSLTKHPASSPSYSLPINVQRKNYYQLNMAVEGDFDPDSITRSVQEAKAGSIKARLRALYKFTRPHTIRGTILASIAGTIRALVDTPGSLSTVDWNMMLPRAFIGMIALLMGNAFIVGINQIYDEKIDKMNKPFLPVASGEMSKRFAWGAVLTGGCVGPLIV